MWLKFHPKTKRLPIISREDDLFYFLVAPKSNFLGVCGETNEAFEVEAIQAAALEAAQQPLAIELAEQLLAVLPEAV